jgi:hypothetical protein
MQVRGYDVVQMSPENVVYRRKATPGTAIIFAILLFPIGLLLLLTKRDEWVNVQATPNVNGRRLTANGSFPKDLAHDVWHMLDMTEAADPRAPVAVPPPPPPPPPTGLRREAPRDHQGRRSMWSFMA